MKRTIIRLASICFFALFSLNVKADTLVGPGGAFQAWTAAVLGPASAPTYGGPYWNNFSGDGPAANIGWCLAGTGGCAIASPPGAIKYYGAGLNAVQNMSFNNNGIAVSVSLLGAFSNQKGGTNGVDYFGWYAIKADGTIGAMTRLWSSTTPASGTSAVFTPTGNYGFFLENVQGNGSADYFWFMNAGSDNGMGSGATGGATADALQHFAVFNGDPGTFFLGIEDTNRGDGDFNDLVVKVTNVLEPGSVLLLTAGLLLLSGVLGRKHCQAKA
jgi:hypothetical protein